MNYKFKYGNFPQGLDLLGSQILSIFDNFVTEPGVRLFFPRQVFTHADMQTLVKTFTPTIKASVIP